MLGFGVNMLISFKGTVVNLDNVCNITIDIQYNLYIITLWFNCLDDEDFPRNIDLHWKEEVDRDEAFDQILSDYQECKRVCRLD